LKPAASTPATPLESNAKTGTSVVKGAPPKETARITVKPNLPSARPAGNLSPAAKPAVAPSGVPIVAAAAAGAIAAKVAVKPGVSSKPATTIIKSGGTTKAAVVKPSGSSGAVVTSYQEEGSTTLTTALAGGLAVLTWGTAGVLIASYMAWF
jgi:hypothetical protein